MTLHSARSLLRQEMFRKLNMTITRTLPSGQNRLDALLRVTAFFREHNFMHPL